MTQITAGLATAGLGPMTTALATFLLEFILPVPYAKQLLGSQIKTASPKH